MADDRILHRCPGGRGAHGSARLLSIEPRIIFEIEQLIASVPVPRIVLLIDRTTDRPFLEQTCRTAGVPCPATRRIIAAGGHRLRVLLASASHQRDVDTLIVLLCESITLPATLTP